MTPACGHLLCELVGGTCSLATGRSRGCRPGVFAREVAPEVFDEVRALLGVIERRAADGAVDAPVHAAAVRLAAIARREAREDRHLVAHARVDEPELAPALERLCLRRR